MVDYEFDKYVKEGAYHWRLAYHPNPLRRHLELRAMYELTCDHLGRHISLESATGVDIGCGDGAFLRAASDRGANIVGIDRSETGLTVGRNKLLRYGIKGELVRGDVGELPFDREFDFAVAIELIEHIPNPAQLVAEANRCLSADGVFVCTTPMKRDSGLRDHRHVQEFTAHELYDILVQEFDNVLIYGYHPGWLKRSLQNPSRIAMLNRAVRGLTRIGAVFWNPYRYISTSEPDAEWNQLVAVCH